ncbi:MAG TPA: hypothetical protein VL382_08105 [Terriglobales bacterium]|nr:hypothetical protein [Terriglobales bacterium]
MRTLKSILVASALALFFALSLSGCFLANLQAWHEPGTAINEPALLGTWSMKNCSDNDENKAKYCVMTLTPHRGSVGGPGDKEDDGYEIVFRGENGQQSIFYAYLFEAGGERFLESAVDEGPKVDPAFAVHVVMSNVVWHVKLENGDLSLEPIQLSWAAQLARDGKLPFHVMLDKNTPLLNAPPKEATALLAQYAKDPAIYDKPLVWKKGTPPGGAAAGKPAAKPKAK